MKAVLIIAVMLGATALGGCAVVSYDYPPSGYYYYDGGWGWGYEGRGYGHQGRGGRSEPGNEAGMYPARPDGRGQGGGGGGSRGGEAGSR